jgi:hypothetical protein
MKQKISKRHNQHSKPKGRTSEILIGKRLEETAADHPLGEETGGYILSFGWEDDEAEQESSTGELGNIDNDEWELRPVNFDPKTGKRLKTGSRAATTAIERFDIQDDAHYCVWCGTRIRGHYSSVSQWIPCVELLERNRKALSRARGGR